MRISIPGETLTCILFQIRAKKAASQLSPHKGNPAKRCSDDVKLFCFGNAQNNVKYYH